ncbi:Hypothetical predicted protein [Mytilus galloprovincialis]|uniref:Uncharacterized protein n=1 Tax=Mytilus galloprovincialis TaxID=29158 RepID=A0A8B6D4V0_MYTGA|nr:Hypothetical predicted protein [Mytilus galloprovincialis]
MTSSQNPSSTPYSEMTDTIIRTTTDYGLPSTDDFVTSEVTTPIKSDKIVGTVISFVIPVGIFLIMIAIMIFTIIRLRRSKRTRSPTKKSPNEPQRPTNTAERKSNSSEDILYLNERNIPTLKQEFHQKKRFNNQEQFNSFDYPLRYHEPYFSHFNTHKSDRRGPDITYGQSMLYKSLGYSIYQVQNGRSRRQYYH